MLAKPLFIAPPLSRYKQKENTMKTIKSTKAGPKIRNQPE